MKRCVSIATVCSTK